MQCVSGLVVFRWCMVEASGATRWSQILLKCAETSRGEIEGDSEHRRGVGGGGVRNREWKKWTQETEATLHRPQAYKPISPAF